MAVRIEQLMEAQGLPESDREEVRRFQQFLRERKELQDAKANGHEQSVPKWWPKYIRGK